MFRRADRRTLAPLLEEQERSVDIVMGLRRAARNYPDRPAVIDGETRLSWREFDGRTRQLAAGLRRLGVQPGDRVAILALNSFRYLELYYGIPRMGGILVPLNYRFAPAELTYTLNDSGAVALVVDEAFAPAAATIRPDLRTVRHVIFAGSGPAPSGMHGYEELLDLAGDSIGDARQPDPNDIAGIFYTGGTTSNAKGVMLTHANLQANALHVLVHLGFRPEHNYLHVPPMFHLADGGVILALTMIGGCHTALPSFNPIAVLETIQRERVTHCGLVPTMINALLQVPTLHEYDLSSWQRVLYGASPIAPDVLKKAMELLPCDFLQGYGMTEASPLLTVLSPEDHRAIVCAQSGSPVARRLTSCGQPIVGVDIRVVNDAGKEVTPGEIGEIVVRGPNVMKGYWNKAEETAYGLRDGWLHTGDLATVDNHNYVFIVDRLKDMIISGGENVYSTEVEAAIYAHPAVLEAAVIGVPDPTWGERVHAVVVLKPNHQATADDIVALCGSRIAGYKVPRSIEFTDALPKSAAGKILKRTVRDKYWQDRERRVS
jgi:long-chain acyl-CoA synthetase